MAYYSEDENEQEQLDPNTQSAVQTGPQASLITGDGQASAASTGSGQKSATPDKPGNFIGIHQYLDANKTQAAKLGDQVSGIVTNSANDARQSVNDLNSAATTAMRPTSYLSSDLANKIANSAETLTDDEKKIVKDTEAAKYNGPKDETELGDAYTNALKATQKAQQLIDSSGTEEGRMGLIKQINSKPRTQGMNVFDGALFQAGGGREKLSQAASAGQDVKGLVDSAAPNIRAQASAAQAQTTAAQQDAYQKVQDALNAWKTGFQPKISQAQQSLIDQQNRITADLGDNQFALNPETASLFGLSDGQRIYGANLSDYLKMPGPNDISAANVASAEDYARYGALADLAGESNLMLNPNDISKAGQLPSLQVDKTGLGGQIQNLANKYTDAYTNSRGNTWFPTGSGTQLQVNTATPKELEEYWIPYYSNPANNNGTPWKPEFIATLKNNLAKWKQSMGYDNLIKRLPTK